MSDPLPPPSHTQKSIDVVRDGYVEKYNMDFGKADNLGVFGAYKFFTPAALYLRSRFFSDKVWLQLMAETGLKLQLMYHKFKHPIFTGLASIDNDRAWEHALWAVPAEQWGTLENYLLSVTFMDIDNKRIERIACQDIEIPDPLLLQTCRVLPAVVPPVAIVAFGLDTNTGCFAFERESEIPGGLELISARRYPPRTKTLKFAAAMLSADDPTQSTETPDAS